MKSTTYENSADVLAEKQHKTKQTKGKTMETTITNQPSLQDLEEKIETGLERYRIAGEALRMIKEQRLYKDQYGTYDEYCRKRWNFTPQYANRLIAAASIAKQIVEKSETIVSLSPPQSENQAGALSRSKNPGIDWMGVQEETGKEQPTAKEIEAYVQKKDNSDTFDAEIIEDKAVESEANSADISSLLSVVGQPYKLGDITGRRRQLNTNVDDATIERIAALKDRLHSDAKGVVMAQSLLLMESFLDMQDQLDAAVDSGESVMAEARSNI